MQSKTVTLMECNELLDRIERRINDPILYGQAPEGSRADMMVPIEMLHELLMVWKACRSSEAQKLEAAE